MNRRVTLMAILAAVVVLVAWYFLLWSPRSDELDEARERKEQAEQENQNLEAQLARLRADQQREPQLRASLEKLRVAIPDRPDLAQFILDTNDAAVRSGIDWVSIAPTPPAAATPAATATTTTTAPETTGTTGTTAPPVAQLPAQIVLSMQVNGGYFQVMDFLNRLDAMPRIVVVDGLTMSADGTGRLSATLTARMFTQPSAVPPPPGQTTTTTAPAAGGTTTTVAGGGTTTTTGARP